MNAPAESRPVTPAWVDAVAGAVGVAAAIGVTELAAGLLPGFPSLVAAIGTAVIARQPPGAKDFVVGIFGTNDKLALESLIVVVALAVGALLGVLSRRWPAIAPLGFGAFGLLAFLATLDDPQSNPSLSIVSAAAATLVGIGVLSFLRNRGRPVAPVAAGQAAPSDGGWSRRRFLVGSAAVAVAAGLGTLLGRKLLDGRSAMTAAAAADIPRASQVATLPAGAQLSVPGITPLVVPNDEFYRIDTALLIPSVDLGSWRLRIHGMVDRETVLTFQDLVSMPLFEQYVTIACVSNQVGGNLVGNAKWTGARLREVLDIAGVQAGASQLVGRSVDGWTAGTPTSWVMDPAREPMIAVRMNDEPLPAAHGFPARLIVPGLYGYVSATKWVTELELTTLEAFDAYWVPLGWAKEAPILTQSRIDVPRDGATVGAGRVVVAGVAWAPDRGVRGVELSVDGGPFQAVRISNPISATTWVQWLYDWDAQPGDHQLAVRAIDDTGTPQTADVSPPAPNGARGHHTIRLHVM